MKYCLLLLLALSGVCLASVKECRSICPLMYQPVCIANNGSPALFANECILGYFRCLTGKMLPTIASKVCENGKPIDGQRLIDNFLRNNGPHRHQSQESDSDSQQSQSESDDSSSES